MSYGYKISKHLDRIFVKLQRKDKKIYEQILEKIRDIISSSDLEHHKNLRHNMKEFKRVHIGSFVLVFKFNKENNLVYFDNFDHHDNIYKK